MNNTGELNTGRHVVFDLHAHLVFTTKYRCGALNNRVREFLHPVMAKICMDFEAKLDAFEGEDDHIHLLVSYPPKIALSSLVNSLKGASSRLVRKQDFSEVTELLWGNSFWSPSYFVASCGGALLDIIKRYVEEQRSGYKKNARKTLDLFLKEEGCAFVLLKINRLISFSFCNLLARCA